ncbi:MULTISPECIES: H-NS family nucleoid-associated regulatory protein [Pseudacidovorax]|jgi:DNA-binding protein H-NS|uniref:Nucleoid protein H-NS n=1 Tax=Pseudacidovorax intermedius TaxID=433924 RepID=A0A370FPY9_9BURK|nr:MULTISPECIES: H-NS histone family protein [Pseudacidovorax]MBO9644187.1 H-NS histone family protein [Pseudacidovorax sp.]MBP6896092.1 H-NS histone family protein [Pseudacidovorax sp.]RDI27293.1 nucleoid protein H-NS [Pseudacidovorax intermedius]
MATLAEITAQIQQRDQEIAELRRQAEELRSHERAGVIEELRKKIAEYGITAADLKLNGRGAATGAKRSVSAAPAKAAAVVKYRSPTGETWSGGRGRKPRWVTEALAAGKSLDEFEVK